MTEETKPGEYNVVTAPTDNNPLAILNRAVESGADIATLERLMDLSERHERNQARHDYVQAMATFQSNCPAIVRRKGIPDNSGRIKYKYSPLEDLQGVSSPVLAANGLTATFGTEMIEGVENVICIVTHVHGHSERTPYPVIATTVPKANQAQNSSASTSYAMRKAYRMALNLRVIGEDDDASGNDVVELVSAEQAANLQGLIDEVGADKAAFLKWGRVEKLSEIPSTWYDKCVKLLEAKRKDVADAS